MTYSKEEILHLVEEEDVEFIRLQFTDLFGTLKNMAVTSSQLKKALNNECMFDGHAIRGFARIEDSDLYLHPDLDTLEIFPWRPQQGKVARLICDVYYPDGTPFEGDPRYILKKELKRAKDMGYTFHVGPECEFFLFHTDDEGMPTTLTHEKGGYFDIAPMDLGENVRRDIVMNLEDLGFEIEASHHESAPAQHEIDIHYEEALKAADNIMTFKLTTRTIAKRHGLHASFMPKPLHGVSGSGMHTNMSLTKDGVNIFYDPEDKNHLSKEAYYFIGGLLKHARGMSAITNPVTNSYKRLVPGFEAPVHIAWSTMNRSPLIRVPGVRGENARIELRSPDSSCNPYLTLAVCLAAGLDGIEHQIEPVEAVESNVYEFTAEQRRDMGVESLPGNLIDAVRAMEEDALVCGILGEETSRKYLKAKEEEWETYRAQVTQWEIEKYL